MEPASNSGKNFVRGLLPWIIALAMLAFYLATSTRWVSFFNLDTVTRLNGWNLVPDLHAPLYAIVTYPLHWVSAKLMPLGLNVFSAICGALTLGLLARSVALLPHDKTDAQRQRQKNPLAFLSIPSAWIPLVLATVVCGLQLTFWEHATNGSPEMFDLLLFAYIIRCLLEYRVDRRETWLTRSAVIYGLAMTNNWAMIGFFPLFVIAVAWMMGWKFFNVRFLVRMFLLGLAGLSLYLLLPLLQAFSDTVPYTFWQGLKETVIAQRYGLFSISRKTFLLISLTSLVPLLIISIRWASYFGDPSPLGVALATVIFHIAHAFFLVTCIWIAFDPQFSPRHIMTLSTSPIPFLTFYYVAALCVGYFSGYFLLVFSNKRDQRSESRYAPQWPKYVNAVLTVAVWLLLGIALGGLLYKNIPAVSTTNGPALTTYAVSLAESIPSRALVLSDDSIRLRLAEAALSRSGRGKDYIPIETRMLKWPEYHKYLQKRFGADWPETVDPKRNALYEDIEIVNLIASLTQNHPASYLNSSFGYYFEFLYPIPHGLTFEMKKYDAKDIFSPPFSDTVIAENGAFWKKVHTDVLPALTIAIASAPPRDNTFKKYFMDKLHLQPEANLTANWIATLYSAPLNSWGVELQKANRLEEAHRYFLEAQQFNSHNIVAAANDAVNQKLRERQPLKVENSKSIQDRFGTFNNWYQVLSQNGPFDDPTICFYQAQSFGEGQLYRQAVMLLTRVITLVPDSFDARLLLAQFYLKANRPVQTLELVSEIRHLPNASNLSSTNLADLLVVETTTLFRYDKAPEAQRLIASTLRQNPDNAKLLNSLFQVSLNFKDYQNAVFAADRLSRINPDDTTLLINKGYLQMQLGDLDAAITTLNRVLTLETNNYQAMFNRAISYLRSEKFDEARKDYETLQKNLPEQAPILFAVDYGLGEIAYRKHETNAAIKNYETYLTHAPTNTAEAKTVLSRLQELKGEKP